MNRHTYFRQQEKNYLCHHGIKGQKWGIRRYQNPDGTLTEEGNERYRKIAENNRKRYKTFIFDQSSIFGRHPGRLEPTEAKFDSEDFNEFVDDLKIHSKVYDAKPALDNAKSFCENNKNRYEKISKNQDKYLDYEEWRNNMRNIIKDDMKKDSNYMKKNNKIREKNIKQMVDTDKEIHDQLFEFSKIVGNFIDEYGKNDIKKYDKKVDSGWNDGYKYTQSAIANEVRYKYLLTPVYWGGQWYESDANQKAAKYYDKSIDGRINETIDYFLETIYETPKYS